MIVLWANSMGSYEVSGCSLYYSDGGVAREVSGRLEFRYDSESLIVWAPEKKDDRDK
jgi:hypothetical protein